METTVSEEIQLVKNPFYNNNIVLMKMFFTQ